jgi:uncharacterized protein with ParB-like and HNH nuclease domain
MTNEKWYEEEIIEEDDILINEYDLTSSPNDFNIKTIYDFMSSGVIKIPNFQRNYVWDIKRASKLIESIILGIPIPQIFLYEEARNSFLVIDGQQRLMSIFYFIKKRFPRKEKVVEIRDIVDHNGALPEEILYDNEYFTDFNLRLPEYLPDAPNKFNKLNYSTLEDYRVTFDLRTIRNIVIKQGSSIKDDFAVYEIFNRLNSGGVNLKPQEIRSSLFHCDFYSLLHSINLDPRWRKVLKQAQPDLQQKDVEIILRAFAILLNEDEYKPSMVKFLNNFSKTVKGFSESLQNYLATLFETFLASCSELPDNAFVSDNNRFNISLFEAVFVAVCKDCVVERKLVEGKIIYQSLVELKLDENFIDYSSYNTTSKSNIKNRIQKAVDYIEMRG